MNAQAKAKQELAKLQACRQDYVAGWHAYVTKLEDVWLQQQAEQGKTMAEFQSKEAQSHQQLQESTQIIADLAHRGITAPGSTDATMMVQVEDDEEAAAAAEAAMNLVVSEERQKIMRTQLKMQRTAMDHLSATAKQNAGDIVAQAEQKIGDARTYPQKKRAPNRVHYGRRQSAPSGCLKTRLRRPFRLSRRLQLRLADADKHFVSPMLAIVLAMWHEFVVTVDNSGCNMRLCDPRLPEDQGLSALETNACCYERDHLELLAKGDWSLSDAALARSRQSNETWEPLNSVTSTVLEHPVSSKTASTNTQAHAIVQRFDACNGTVPSGAAGVQGGARATFHETRTAQRL